MRGRRQQNVSDRGVANTIFWVGNENWGVILEKWGRQRGVWALEMLPSPSSEEKPKILLKNGR